MFTTILRGFKVPVAVLDAFLTANGLDETFGTPPLDPDAPEISGLLRNKMNNNGEACVSIPQREAYSRSTVAYVAYCWVKVFAQREINVEKELPEQVPTAFEDLTREMMAFSNENSISLKDESMGRIGTFVVFTGSVRWVSCDLRAKQGQNLLFCPATELSGIDMY